MAAPETPEMGLIDPVAFRAVPTYGTGAARVPRIDQDHAHAGLGRLVRDTAPKLAKRPSVARTTLRPSNRPSLADPGQILQRECLTGRARLGNQFLADAVVDIPLEPRLTTGVFPEPPAGATGVRFLESLAVLKTALAHLSYLRAAIGGAVGVGRQIDHAQINAQDAGRFVRGGIGLRLRDVQGERAVALPPPAPPHSVGGGTGGAPRRSSNSCRTDGGAGTRPAPIARSPVP